MQYPVEFTKVIQLNVWQNRRAIDTTDNQFGFKSKYLTDKDVPILSNYRL